MSKSVILTLMLTYVKTNDQIIKYIKGILDGIYGNKMREKKVVQLR